MDVDDWRTIRDVLSAIKYIVESKIGRRLDFPRHNLALELAMEIERARILAGSFSRTNPNVLQIGAQSEVRHIVSSILKNGRNSEFLSLTFKNRNFPFARPSRRESNLARHLNILRDENLPIGAVLERLSDVLSREMHDEQEKFSWSSTLDRRTLNDLRRTIPPQRIAPIEVDIVDGRLVQKQRPITGEPQDQNNIAKAASALIDSGNLIVHELSRSNCDRRLTDALKQLQSEIELRDNVIQLGLLNITCENLCNQFAPELPTAVIGMLNAHTRGVELLLSQYPEWNRFIENAHSASMSDVLVFEIQTQALEVATKMEKDEALVEPKVPKSLRYLAELIKTPGQAAKRFAFAILRSIENIVSRLYLFGVEFFEESLALAAKRAAKTVSKVAVVSLLGIALQGAGVLEPLATSITELGWLKSTTESVQKMMKELSGK